MFAKICQDLPRVAKVCQKIANISKIVIKVSTDLHSMASSLYQHVTAWVYNRYTIILDNNHSMTPFRAISPKPVGHTGLLSMS